MPQITLQDIFINNLKFYRKESKLSQEALSEKLNKGTNYINKIESRASFPTIQVVEQIANTLGIKASQLFEENRTPRNIVEIDRDKFISDVTEKLCIKISAEMKTILEKL